MIVFHCDHLARSLCTRRTAPRPPARSSRSDSECSPALLSLLFSLDPALYLSHSPGSFLFDCRFPIYPRTLLPTQPAQNSSARAGASRPSVSMRRVCTLLSTGCSDNLISLLSLPVDLSLSLSPLSPSCAASGLGPCTVDIISFLSFCILSVGCVPCEHFLITIPCGSATVKIVQAQHK
jgi:hypothetical protein